MKKLVIIALMGLLPLGCTRSANRLSMHSGSSYDVFESFTRVINNAEEWGDVKNFLDRHEDKISQKYDWDDDEGYTFLHYAAQQGDQDVVEELIRRGIAVDFETDKKRRTPLHLAARGGHLEAVKCLVSLGADVHKRDCRGGTVLHYATMNEHREVIDYLIAQGAELNARDGSGFGVLHLAAQVCSLELTKLFLDTLGSDARYTIDAPSENGTTALHIATNMGCGPIVQLLLNAGANKMITNDIGQIALNIAEKKGYTTIVALLR